MMLEHHHNGADEQKDGGGTADAEVDIALNLGCRQETLDIFRLFL
jgi:hypothetical protein